MSEEVINLSCGSGIDGKCFDTCDLLPCCRYCKKYLWKSCRKYSPGLCPLTWENFSEFLEVHKLEIYMERSEFYERNGSN